MSLFKSARFWVIILISVLSLSFIVWSINFSDKDDDSDSENGENGSGQEILWGVDSATYTTKEIYECVVNNYGEPDAWGRYIGSKKGVSSGLDQDEIDFLHEKDIPIIPIYNHFTDATGYDNGKNEAKKAIEIAKELGIKEGVYLFADIEPEYPVDFAFIQGWTDQLASSPYKSGIYGVFDEGSNLFKAFEAAASENDKVADEVVVWTSYPQEKVTKKDNAPKFNPEAPKSANALIWQYGLDDETCNIDTNLLREKMLEGLW